MWDEHFLFFACIVSHWLLPRSPFPLVCPPDTPVWHIGLITSLRLRARHQHTLPLPLVRVTQCSNFQRSFWAKCDHNMLIGQVIKKTPDKKGELAAWSLCRPQKIKVSSITLLARRVDTIERQLIFILGFSLPHVKLCLIMTSSSWPHSGLESPFNFPAELLLWSNCIQANTKAWCGHWLNRHKSTSTYSGQCRPAWPKYLTYLLSRTIWLYEKIYIE